MVQKKRIAVIGGGFGGLLAIRSLKEEGLEPVCFERTSSLGGTWCYRELSTDGVPSIMPFTVTNHSKEMGALSNFPPDAKFPNYMRHFEVYQYFKDIGERFDCFRHMILNKEVVSVRRSEDYETTGKWTVKVRDTIGKRDVVTDTFDGVVVSVGHITYPKMAEFPRMNEFKGSIIHTHSLKDVKRFSGKRVCVVGIGCSALDAAVETSGVAQQLFLSTRSGAWIFPRIGPQGVPMDYAFNRRYMIALQEMLPISVSSSYIERNFLNAKLDHELYNLRPEHHVFCKELSINDSLPEKLISGSVLLKRNIKHFTENGVMFEGDEKITEVDVVIMATGYRWKFPFLEHDIVTTEKDGRINLYKCMWPPNLRHQTLAMIGFVLPMGPGFPVGEMQSRWAARVLSGKVKLPSKNVMMKEIIKRHEANAIRYRPGDEKTSIRVDYVPYMDDIASEFGAKPNLLKLLVTDPTLFKACLFGPYLSYQYRLQGPNSWSGARDAILSATERMRTPLVGSISSVGRMGAGDNDIMKDALRENSQQSKIQLRSWIKFLINLILLSLLITQNDLSITSLLLMAMLLPQYVLLRSFILKYVLAGLSLLFLVSRAGLIDNYIMIALALVSLATFNYL